MPPTFHDERWGNFKDTLIAIASTKLLKEEGEIFLPCWAMFKQLDCQEFIYTMETTNVESNPLFQATCACGPELAIFVNRDVRGFHRLTYKNPPDTAEAEKTLQTYLTNKRKGVPTGGTRENPMVILDEEQDMENKIVAHIAASTKATGCIKWTRAKGKIYFCDDEDSDDHDLYNESDLDYEEEGSTDEFVEVASQSTDEVVKVASSQSTEDDTSQSTDEVAEDDTSEGTAEVE